MTEETRENTSIGWGFGLYFAGISTILRIVLNEGFSLSFRLAFALAILVTSLGAYPIFIRGSKTKRRFWFQKDERFTFLPWLTFTIVATLIAFVVGTFL